MRTLDRLCIVLGVLVALSLLAMMALGHHPP
jgi:hypothetical protein